jgi:predicted nucleic acid-binding protein
VTVFVLDNSIAMRWAFATGAHPHADAILRDLQLQGSEAVVPVLWRYEASAVLAVAQTRGTIPAHEVAFFLQDLEGLPIRIDPESSRRIFSDVHWLAVSYRLTSYDAAYLELALRRALPLATLDNELIAACHKAGVSVL